MPVPVLCLKRDYVVPDDVREVFEDVCAHRLVMKPQAKIEGVRHTDVLSQVMKDVSRPCTGRKTEVICVDIESGTGQQFWLPC